MKIEIVDISTEIIPPSSPTPNDLSNYKLSFIDQRQTPVFVRFIFFYEASASSLSKSEISSSLKKSLMKTLSLYHPLAGRLVDRSNVDCNNQGITYVEATANCTFLEVIKEPIDLEELDKLLPQNLDDERDVCIKIQTTFFKCQGGGFTIGVALSHKLGDSWSLLSFFNSWAAISREEDDDAARSKSPIFDGATIFPPNFLGGNDPRIVMVSKENIITKRFIFTASKIEDLRDKYTNTTRATRVEALLGFIWTRFMVSTQTKDDHKKNFALLLAVNFRKRAVPPLPDHLFGNFVFPAMVVVPPYSFSLGSDGEQQATYGVIEKMREAILSIDGDFVQKLGEESQVLKDTTNKFMNGELEPFYFTSYCRFPLFEADFGWGVPVWIAPGSGGFKNAVTFIDSPSGGGGIVPVWIVTT